MRIDLKLGKKNIVLEKREVSIIRDSLNIKKQKEVETGLGDDPGISLETERIRNGTWDRSWNLSRNRKNSKRDLELILESFREALQSQVQ